LVPTSVSRMGSAEAGAWPSPAVGADVRGAVHASAKRSGTRNRRGDRRSSDTGGEDPNPPAESNPDALQRRRRRSRNSPDPSSSETVLSEPAPVQPQPTSSRGNCGNAMSGPPGTGLLGLLVPPSVPPSSPPSPPSPPVPPSGPPPLPSSTKKSGGSKLRATSPQETSAPRRDPVVPVVTTRSPSGKRVPTGSVVRASPATGAGICP